MRAKELKAARKKMDKDVKETAFKYQKAKRKKRLAAKYKKEIQVDDLQEWNFTGIYDQMVFETKMKINFYSLNLHCLVFHFNHQPNYLLLFCCFQGLMGSIRGLKSRGDDLQILRRQTQLL